MNAQFRAEIYACCPVEWFGNLCSRASVHLESLHMELDGFVLLESFSCQQRKNDLAIHLSIFKSGRHSKGDRFCLDGLTVLSLLTDRNILPSLLPSRPSQTIVTYRLCSADHRICSCIFIVFSMQSVRPSLSFEFQLHRMLREGFRILDERDSSIHSFRRGVLPREPFRNGLLQRFRLLFFFVRRNK